MRDNTPVSRARQLTSSTWSGLGAENAEYHWFSWSDDLEEYTVSAGLFLDNDRTLTEVRADVATYSMGVEFQVSLLVNNDEVVYLTFGSGVYSITEALNVPIAANTDEVAAYMEYLEGPSEYSWAASLAIRCKFE